MVIASLKNKVTVSNKKINDRFKSIIEASPNGIATVSKIGIVTFCNPTFLKLTGYPEDEIVGKHISKLPTIRKKNIPKYLKLLAPVFKGGNLPEIEFDYITKSKETRFGKAILSLVKKEGKVTELMLILRDITAEKNTEKALDENEKKYRDLVENLPEGIAEIDAKGKITFANKKIFNQSGYNRNDFKKGLYIFQMVDKKDQLKLKKNFAKILKGNIIGRQIYTIKRKDETTYIAFIHTSTIKNIKGKITGFRVIVVNITKQTDIENKLRESEKNYRVLYSDAESEKNKFKSLIESLTSIGIGIDIVSKDHKIYYQNKLLEDNFGKLSGGELCYKKYKGLEKHCDECNIDQALKEKKSFSREEIGSNQRIYNIISAPIPGFNGNSNKVIEVVTDITEQKKSEEEIKNLSKFPSENPNPVARINFDGKTLYKNKACKNGIRVGEDAPEPIYNVVKNMIKNKSSKPETIDICMGDKTFEFVIAPVMESNYANVYGRDITKRKNAELKIKDGYIKLQKTFDDTIKTLASIVETRDPYTSGHQKRVAQLTTSISKEIGLNKEKIEAIKTSALLHDIGKMNIPASILARPGKISDIEYTMIKTHSQLGYDILKNIEFPWPVADFILQHHEREDGSGYPNGLKGKDILLEAKILLVADVIEAMSSHRPYRPALGMDKALREIKKNKGKLYDPKIVDACIELFENKGFKFKN